MGNCCLKKQIKEPNQPVTVVHLSTGGRVVRVLSQRSITRTTSPNGIRIRSKKVISNAGAAKRDDDKRHDNPLSLTTRNDTLEKVHKKDKEESRPRAHSKIRCFCYAVLKDATNNFSRKNLIGEGGFGDVYKGYVTHCTMSAAKPNEGFPIAIKRLIQRRPQGCEAWKTEVRILSQLNHPNIVKLIGCCREGSHRMLVYEYMDEGSLDNCLFRENRKELNWGRRIRIAVGAARGLAYLHTNETPIIHRDIKASNFLLDSKFRVKISDFGLAKYGPEDDDDHISTRVIGTKGYFAPEYFKTGHLTVKADVYSFGVVLLEILSGSCVDKRCPKGVRGNLVERAKPLLCRGNVELRCVMDDKLGKNVPMEEARKFAELTYRCLSEDPNRRPTMDEVLTSLEQLQQIVGGDNNHHDSLSFVGFSACPPPFSKKASRKKCMQVKMQRDDVLTEHG
ncbi:probable serine/threonine-protein kinase PBL11 [Morus notabilis]|uniref:probable serine/threonine-protein kinase PBL11 n=1 Tax=Morus notabilis TaxID=981085 RepID=UPI000CED32A1|nr:probable serine/threonine-protein kinase PBL11 [Morus notabilis]